ncbi:MAG TPA: winged helix-turn-helix domain-containing protein [Pseudolabrys sp.]|nr:winged helix-turn-helix domain-containing protein [Pseudolabrys sp.]
MDAPLTVFRFANFELDRQRAELRGPDGAPIKLRRKSFDMLTLFAANAGRVLSKQELTEAVWPKVHVGEDSLFQCIREVRNALGDDRHAMIKVVPGRGYRFDVEVAAEVERAAAKPSAQPAPEPTPEPPPSAEPSPSWFRFSRPAALAALAIACVVGLAMGAPIVAPDFFQPAPPRLSVTPIEVSGGDEQMAAIAANVTERLTDGLATIDNLRVIAASPRAASAKTPDFILKSGLERNRDTWVLRTRLIVTSTGEVRPIPTVSVGIDGIDPLLQRTRLAAGLGHQVAKEINSLLNPSDRTAAPAESADSAGKAAVEQAIASINRTTRERFGEAQTILEKALAERPANTDVAVALAALKLRGIQLVWYGREQRFAAEDSARSLLESALRARPNSLPVLDAYCRLLVATNQFVDGLVACARTLSFDPWDGTALYHIGLAQLQLGRFDDALESFEQADRYDTPAVSRWTWLLGAGIACLMLDRPQEAVSWLNRSLAITVGSGRTHMVLAAAYQQIGRTTDAKAAMAKGLALRPGTTVLNVTLPFKNTSPVYRAATDRALRFMVAAGLPER